MRRKVAQVEVIQNQDVQLNIKRLSEENLRLKKNIGRDVGQLAEQLSELKKGLLQKEHSQGRPAEYFEMEQQFKSLEQKVQAHHRVLQESVHTVGIPNSSTALNPGGAIPHEVNNLDSIVASALKRESSRDFRERKRAEGLLKDLVVEEVNSSGHADRFRGMGWVNVENSVFGRRGLRHG